MSEERFDRLENKVGELIEKLRESEELRQNNAKIIDNNFQVLNQKIDFIASSMAEHHTDTSQNFTDVKFELVKIQRATGYEEFYANLKIVGDED